MRFAVMNSNLIRFVKRLEFISSKPTLSKQAKIKKNSKQTNTLTITNYVYFSKKYSDSFTFKISFVSNGIVNQSILHVTLSEPWVIVL